MPDLRPPGPRGLLGNSHLLVVRRNPETFLRLARQYGDLVYFRIGSREVFLVSRPSLIEKIFGDHYAHFEKDWGPRKEHALFGNALLTSERDDHKAQRQELSRVFARGAIEDHRPVVEEIIRSWSGKRRAGETVDLFEEMSGLSTEIAARTLFGCSLDTTEVRNASAAVARGFRRFMFPFAGRFRFGVDRTHGTRKLIAQIRAHAGSHVTPDCLLRKLLVEGRPGIDAVIATFLITGQETLRIATSLSWWLLSRQHEAARKLEVEARERVGTGGTGRLPIAEAVLSESLRLYPPQWMIGRRAITPYDLDGYEVPTGALVLLCPYIVQRDARHFPEPEKFDPERWLGPGAGPSERFAYFPFGGGPRRCIGESFAMTFGSLILSVIARDWRFECDEREPRWDVRLTLRPRSIPARVQPISRAPSV